MTNSIHIAIYTTEWCPHSKALKEFLNENNVTYTEYDVEEDDDKWKEGMRKAGGRDIVPVVDIDGKVFYGNFSEIKGKIASELDIEPESR